MSPKNPLMVVGLSGKMRSGKTWVSDHLCDAHGFAQYRFAGPLKDDIRSMDFPEWAIEKKPDWMRLLMQAYGQAWRALDPDHWVKQLTIDLRNHRALQLSGAESRPVVIDDMRFKNESRALRELDPNEFDVRLVRLFRLGDPGDVAHTQDVSETDLDHWEDWDSIVQAVAGDTNGLVQGVEKALGLPHRR